MVTGTKLMDNQEQLRFPDNVNAIFILDENIWLHAIKDSLFVDAHGTGKTFYTKHNSRGAFLGPNPISVVYVHFKNMTRTCPYI